MPFIKVLQFNPVKILHKDAEQAPPDTQLADKPQIFAAYQPIVSYKIQDTAFVSATMREKKLNNSIGMNRII